MACEWFLWDGARGARYISPLRAAPPLPSPRGAARHGSAENSLLRSGGGGEQHGTHRAGGACVSQGVRALERREEDASGTVGCRVIQVDRVMQSATG